MVFINRPVITVLLNSEQNQELLFCDKDPKYPFESSIRMATI